MRKFLNSVVMATGLMAGFFVCRAEAGFFNAQADANYVKYTMPASVGASTAAIIVDLSDTSNFAHKDTGSLRVQGYDIVIDQVAAGTSTVKLGVVTSVNASSGTVRWFETIDNTLNVSNTNKNIGRYFVPASIDLLVTGAGTTPGLVTKTVTAITPVVGEPLLYQTDVSLPTAVSPTSVAFPSKGDIVMETNATAANGVRVSVGILYYSLP